MIFQNARLRAKVDDSHIFTVSKPVMQGVEVRIGDIIATPEQYRYLCGDKVLVLNVDKNVMLVHPVVQTWDLKVPAKVTISGHIEGFGYSSAVNNDDVAKFIVTNANMLQSRDLALQDLIGEKKVKITIEEIR